MSEASPRLALAFRVEAERVVLRAPRASDAGPVLALSLRSRAFLEPWMPRFPPEGADEAAIAARFRAERRDWKHNRAYRFLVVLRQGAIAGTIKLSQVTRGPFECAYLGYWIGAEHAGQGLMTEALGLALGLAFGPLGLHRVQAAIQPGNRASVALVRRLGFRREGLARDYLRIAGGWRDHAVYALTAEGWPAGPAARR